MYIKENKKHLFNCSLGKDSTAELIVAKRLGVSIDRVVFADLQDADFPQMKDMLYKLQDFIGIEFEIIKAPFTFEEKFFQPVKRGNWIRPYRGFPPTVGKACWIKRDMKINPINKWVKSNNLTGYVRHFGFAKGEEDRLACQPDAVSLLIEQGITEAGAREICESEGLLNPLYNHFLRLGCWFCPKKSLRSWYMLWLHYPELWQKLKYYEKFCVWKLTPKYNTDEMEQLFITDKFLKRHGFERPLCICGESIGGENLCQIG